MTTRRLMLTLTVGVALFACVAGLILEVRRAERAERTLEEIYQSALSETAEQMQALSLTLEKALVTGDVSQNVKLLAQVSQLSEDVRRNLTFLPLSHEAMAPTLTFANQLAEYAAVLLPVLVKEGELPGSDASQLETLLTDLLSAKQSAVPCAAGSEGAAVVPQQPRAGVFREGIRGGAAVGKRRGQG